jgi:ComEC/Rec2-related protein
MAPNDPNRPRAKVWDIDAARKRAGALWPAALSEPTSRLRQLIAQWALAEVAPGRLLPWLAVAFGSGIVLYFTADREPAWWSAAMLAFAGIAIAFATRRRAIGFPLALGFAGIAAGFATATLQTQRIAHPVLQITAASVVITGFVEMREERERSDRIVVRVHSLEGRHSGEAPERVRVAVRKGTAPLVGSFISFKAYLSGIMAQTPQGAIIPDRPAITFRTLTVAALGVLLFAPEAVVHPSFQMSFAATLALVSGYQVVLPWHPTTDTSLGARFARWGGRELVGLTLASLVTGLATTPYAAYHFHRLAPYGVLSILLAMPVVSAVVMPAGIIGVLVMPFGFDAPFWRLMGVGIDWMIKVVLWVTSLPGSVGSMRDFGTGPQSLGTVAILLLCLLRTPLRWSGAVLAVIASLWALSTPRPDVWVSDDGQVAALRGPSGQLSVLHTGRDTFSIKEWLAADGDARTVKDASLRDGVRCDAVGCVGKLADGRLVSMALSAEAFEEDCARAAVVVAPRDAPGDCAAVLIDRKAWRANGAVTLRWTGDRFERSMARPRGFERPWARTLPGASEAAPATARPAARDATPRQEDMEAGD